MTTPQLTKEERRQRRAERFKARIAARTLEEKAAISAKLKARHAARTPEQHEAFRQEMRSMAQAWRASQTPEERQRQGEKAKATKAAKSPEEKAATSAKLKARWEEWTPERRAVRLAPSHATGTPAMLATRPGHKQTPEQRAKHSATKAALWADSDWAATHRAQMSERSLRQWEDKSHEERLARTEKARRVGRSLKNSRLESAIAAVFDTLKIVYERQYKIGRLRVDFYIPDRNLIVECDGRYWHTIPSRAEADQQRDARLHSLGYQVLRLSEDSILSDPMKAVATAI